jgi:hypothetical protein
MLRLARILLIFTCVLTCGTAAVAQKKNSETEAARKNLEEVQKRVDASIAADRKRRGFPPEDDYAGTITHCAKLAIEWRDKADTCVGEQLKELIVNRSESAETIADAVMGSCRSLLRGLVGAVTPYCMSREKAQPVIDTRVNILRELAITAIVRYRTGLVPVARPKSSQ